MQTIITILIIGLALLNSQAVLAAPQNVVLVTLDGVRWQEVFNGADNKLINNKLSSITLFDFFI